LELERKTCPPYLTLEHPICGFSYLVTANSLVNHVPCRRSPYLVLSLVTRHLTILSGLLLLATIQPLESSLPGRSRSAGTRRSTQKGYTLYPTHRLSWIYRAFHSVLSVIESRNPVSIYTGHNCYKLEITVQYSAGGLSVGKKQPTMWLAVTCS
jgi:hypothetical protein